MQIHLKTLGCRLNEAELQSWANDFQSRGHRIEPDAEQADLLVINTCAVTREAVKKSRQMIRRTHRQNPNAKLVVSGCYASLNQELHKDIESIDLLIDNKDKDRLVDIALRELNLKTMPAMSTEPGETALFTRGRNRAFIKVQDGCRYRCTFCIVTIARGDEHSRTPAKIIDEINATYEQGIQEVVLTGVHLGGYGSDLDINLYQLIEQILNETDVPRIRLGSLEPWDLPDDFFSLFSNTRLMPHLHLPMQSGCDSVLKRMARRCKTAEFEKLALKARQSIRDFNLTTDIIVGFPGETEEEWKKTLAYLSSIGFSHIHIFPYSKRTGTRAATLPDQLEEQVKRKRSRELHDLACTMRNEFIQTMLGKSYPVLWESRNEHGRWYGYTNNYMRVVLEDDAVDLENSILPVTATGIDSDETTLTVRLI